MPRPAAEGHATPYALAVGGAGWLAPSLRCETGSATRADELPAPEPPPLSRESVGGGAPPYMPASPPVGMYGGAGVDSKPAVPPPSSAPDCPHPPPAVGGVFLISALGVLSSKCSAPVTRATCERSRSIPAGSEPLSLSRSCSLSLPLSLLAASSATRPSASARVSTSVPLSFFAAVGAAVTPSRRARCSLSLYPSTSALSSRARTCAAARSSCALPVSSSARLNSARAAASSEALMTTPLLAAESAVVTWRAARASAARADTSSNNLPSSCACVA
mmetsp:Transcript_23557/g.59715  ORF Transcript_23557/g.59715 Transcript_23557/m.59715 type:complete len:276 (+) Transcript_23557:215-1042(+)